MSPHARAVPLSESLENMVEHCRRNAPPGVITTIRTSWLARSRSSLTRLPTRVNLPALMMRSTRLLEAGRISGDHARLCGELALYHDGLASAGGRTASSAPHKESRRSIAVTSRRILLPVMRARSSRSPTSCCAATAFLRVNRSAGQRRVAHQRKGRPAGVARNAREPVSTVSCRRD